MLALSMGDTEFDEKFKQYRESLHDEMSRVASYFAIYRRFHRRKSDRLREINIAPAFFQVTADALFVSLVLWVSKLYDKGSSAVSGTF